MEAGRLFTALARAAHASGEPGVAFYGAINRANPVPGLGPLEATNPCGEQPLLPYESCNLGSLVLPRFVKNGAPDLPALEEAAALAIRFLDDALEANRFPCRRWQRPPTDQKGGPGGDGFRGPVAGDGHTLCLAKGGLTGPGNHGRHSKRGQGGQPELARQRGAFPAFGESREPKAWGKPLRNATVTTVAPTGTLSLLLGCSSGIEPLFALAYTRRVLESKSVFELNPRFASRLAKLGLDTPANLEAVRSGGRASCMAGLPNEDRELLATSHEIPPEAHLAVQAAFQEHTDNAVSKTVNLPASAAEEDVRRVFIRAFELGLKGVTVFRDGCRGRQVLELLPLPGAKATGHAGGSGCCPRCGGNLATDGGCMTCTLCGASSCE